MRRFAAVVVLAALSGCCLIPDPPPGDSEKPKDLVRAVPAVYDRILYGEVKHYRLGDWVKYRIKGDVLTIKVVGREGHMLWIEYITERGDKKEISLQQVDVEGRVVKSYFSESGTVGVATQEIRKFPAESPPPPQYDSVDRTDITVEVAGKRISAQQVKKTYFDTDGLMHVETYVYSKEVPPIFTRGERGVSQPSAEGGLVRRDVRASEVELLDFGTGAKPSIEIPK